MFKNFIDQYYILLTKAKLIYFFTIIASFLLPIKMLLLTVGAFIAADTVIGIYRAKKKKEKVTSRKLSNLVSKMVLYQSAVILFFCLEKFILGDFIHLFVDIELFLTKIVAATLCLIEIKSIDESYFILNGYSLFDKFKAILKRAKSTKDEISNFKD